MQILNGQMVKQQLEQDPADSKALTWMLEHLDPNASAENLKQAVDMILTAMITKPQQADVFSVLLVANVKDAKQLIEQIQNLPDVADSKALRLYLLAQAWSRQGDIDKTRELLEQAIALDDQLLVARLRLAVLHMSQKELQKADEVLKPIKDQTDPRVVARPIDERDISAAPMVCAQLKGRSLSVAAARFANQVVGALDAMKQ